jgi:hypothetical protein
MIDLGKDLKNIKMIEDIDLQDNIQDIL